MDDKKVKKKVRFSENLVSSVKEFIVDPEEYNSGSKDILKIIKNTISNIRKPVKRKLELTDDSLSIDGKTISPSPKKEFLSDDIYDQDELELNSTSEINNHDSGSLFEIDDDNVDIDIDDQSLIRNIIKSKHLKGETKSNEKQEETDIFFNNDVEKSDIKMDVDQMIGQEPSTIKSDGEIMITPFNLKDELEEGYFDKNGTFIFNKTDYSSTDAWLDMLDEFDNNDGIYDKINASKCSLFDSNIKGTKQENLKNSSIKSSKNTDNFIDSSNSTQNENDLINMYNLENGVTDECEQNLTSNKIESDLDQSSSIEDFDSVKAMLKIVDILKPNEKVISAIKRLGKDKSLIDQFNLLTENADNLLYYSSEVNIYQLTKESIQYKLEKSTNSNVITNETKQDDPPQAIQVMWMYKWQETEEQTFGPYDTKTMLTWKEQGFFDGHSVICKKHDLDDSSQFYPIHRIDFDLYL